MNNKVVKERFPEAIDTVELYYLVCHIYLMKKFLGCVDINNHMDKVCSLQGMMREALFMMIKNSRMRLKYKVVFLLMSINTSVYYYAKKVYHCLLVFRNGIK